MDIKKKAIAGSVESSDALVIVEPNDSGIEIDLESSVLEQYGESIRQTTRDVLDKLGVENAVIRINDQGALDCTIKSRIQTAVLRANDVTENIDWGGMIS